MRKSHVLLFVVMLCTVSMRAQSDKFELFGGYSLERIAAGCHDYRCTNDTGVTSNLNGWTVSAVGYLHKSLGLSAQFSGDYGNAGYDGGDGLASVNRYAYQFGPVYTVHWQRASAFAHALFGAVSQNVSRQTVNGSVPGYTEFLWSVGGGLDVKLAQHLSIRAVQLDYERHNIPASNSNVEPVSPTNGFRYSAGIVLRF